MITFSFDQVQEHVFQVVLLATEAGNCVCWTGVTEQVQADRLTAAFAKWKTYSWAHVLTYFYYHDTSCCTGFGLTRSDFTHRLAWAAYQAAAA